MQRVWRFAAGLVLAVVLPVGSIRAAPTEGSDGAVASQELLAGQQVFAVPESTVVASFGPPVLTGRIDVECPTAEVCFVAGGGLSVTHDGGASWDSTDLPNGWSARFVDCFSATSCAVLFTGSTPTGWSQVLWTHDAGQSWTAATKTFGQVEALACPTISTCVLVEDSTGGTFSALITWTTFDSGVSWRRNFSSLNGPSSTQIACSTSGLCVINEYFSLLSSADFGASWTELDLPSRFGRGRVACPAADLCVSAGVGGDVSITVTGFTAVDRRYYSNGVMGLECTGSTQCARFAYDQLFRQVEVSHFQPPTPDSPVVADEPIELESSTSILGVDCSGPHCLLLREGAGASANAGALTNPLTSADLGATWTPTNGVVGGFSPSQMACSEVACLLAGGSGATPSLRRSTDGGRTWTALSGPGTDDEVSSLACSEMLCVVLLDRGVLVSIDGGITFDHLTTVSPRSVDCAAGRCLGVDAHLSGSTTWAWSAESTTPQARQVLPVARSSSVACMDHLRCLMGYWDATLQGGLRRTLDGGVTWSELAVDEPMEAVGCSEGVCLLRLLSGNSLITTDLGQSFTDFLPFDAAPSVFSCQGELCVVSTDGHQSWWTSADGGASWVRLPHRARLRAVECSDVWCFGVTQEGFLQLTLVTANSIPIPITVSVGGVGLAPAERLGPVQA
ncbi:MAG TPA: hypothetical protein DCR14_12450 [Acidimicrobiaceae bacterium]|nr:hypothetical protein [Acidimicrobiaceae bacterium]